MEEGLRKFADPQNALLKLIAEKRSALTAVDCVEWEGERAALARRWETTGGLTPRRSHA